MVVEDKYKTVRIPKAILEKLDNYLKEHPEYVSRLEIIKEAIRMHMRD